jgi:hypothetical protein
VYQRQHSITMLDMYQRDDQHKSMAIVVYLNHDPATATLRCILDRSADHMPHRSRTLASGDKVVSKVLPATRKWKESIPELNIVNSAFGLKDQEDELP